MSMLGLRLIEDGKVHHNVPLTDILRTDYERKIEANKGFFLCGANTQF